MRLRWIGLIGLLMAVAAPAWAEDETALARELLDGYDDMYRGESSTATMIMNVKTARWERSLRMKVWSKGEEKSLIRIESPAKEAGVTTLKVDDNIWNYLPKVDRTMKVPAGMMGGSWMGSHFSNDDLVKESRMADDYTYSITERPDGETGNWVVQCEAKADAAVVWGKVLVKLRPDRLAETITYWDEKGVLIRTMSFENYTDVGGRLMPLTMRLIPEDKPGEFTEIIYDELDLDVEVPDSMFSLQALK
jgi:outer membrane lipoprotein-sorting protein